MAGRGDLLRDAGGGWGACMGGRAGRKRKYGAREKNGRAKRKPQQELLEERVRIARAQPHRRELKSNDRISELAESSLGRLALRGLVSGAERAAGEAFASIVAGYRAVIEGPRPMRSLMPDVTPEREKNSEDLAARFSCATAGADPSAVRSGSITVYRFPCQAPGEICECAARRTRYMRAYEAIARAGRAAVLAVTRVAVRGEEVAPADLVNLKRGLDAAAAHLGLTGVDR